MFEFHGIGIHTGETCSIFIEPNNSKSVTLIRNKLLDNTPIKPGIPTEILGSFSKNIVLSNPEGLYLKNNGSTNEPGKLSFWRWKLSNDSARSTDLFKDGTTIKTVEHLMATLCALGLGAIVSMTGPEIPIMDGSALEFYNGLKNSKHCTTPRKLIVNKSYEIKHNDSTVKIIPVANGEEPTYSVHLNYKEPSIGALDYYYKPFEDSFLEIASARTFALKSEVDALKSTGKAKGGSLDNALVLDFDKPLNANGKRFENEPARHKMLDLIGDLSLLGALPLAHIKVHIPGHQINHQIIKALLNS